MRRSEGFTLIEMSAAIFILGIGVIGALVLFPYIVDQLERSRKQLNVQQVMTSVTRSLQQQLQQVSTAQMSSETDWKSIPAVNVGHEMSRWHWWKNRNEGEEDFTLVYQVRFDVGPDSDLSRLKVMTVRLSEKVDGGMVLLKEESVDVYVPQG